MGLFKRAIAGRTANRNYYWTRVILSSGIGIGGAQELGFTAGNMLLIVAAAIGIVSYFTVAKWLAHLLAVVEYIFGKR